MIKLLENLGEREREVMSGLAFNSVWQCWSIHRLLKMCKKSTHLVAHLNKNHSLWHTFLAKGSGKLQPTISEALNKLKFVNMDSPQAQKLTKCVEKFCTGEMQPPKMVGRTFFSEICFQNSNQSIRFPATITSQTLWNHVKKKHVREYQARWTGAA